MALITCPECDGKVSDKADSCPHCGYPINKFLYESKSQINFNNNQDNNCETSVDNIKKHAGRGANI